MIFQIDNYDATIELYLAAGFGVAYGCWRLLLRPYFENKKPFANLPMAPESHWLLGHMSMYWGKDIDQSQRKIATAGGENNELGRTGYWMGPKPNICLVRWQDARAVLNAESWRTVNPVAKKMFKNFIPNSILAMNGREWKHNRAAINKSFTPTGLSASTDAMIEVTETVGTSLKERIASQSGQYYQCEIEPLMKWITIDVFGKSTFSRDFACAKNLKSNEFAAAMDSIGNRDGTFNAAKDTIHSYTMDMINERRAELEEGSTAKKNDLLTCIINANDKNGKNDDVSSDEVLRDVVTTVLFAGYDTTSVTLTYALYMLSQNPDIVAKCLEEISSVESLKDHGDLVYCKAVITETLRLFPPAAQTFRTLKKPIKLPSDGFVIPAETGVMVPIWSIHRDERNFARPLEFLPERWVRRESTASARWVEHDPTSDDDSTSTVPAANPKAFFAFSGGGRNCPGMKFAWQEAVVVLAGLLTEFDFEAMPDYELKVVRGGPVQHPDDGMPMKIALRKNKAATTAATAPSLVDE